MAHELKNIMMTPTNALSDENSLSLTASFGISELGETIEDLLNHSDEDIYLAKNGCRNHALHIKLCSFSKCVKST